MIPKIIHYCWFGKKKKPKEIEKCIDSWHKVLPEYQFMEWNEENFDINCNKYTRRAYDENKYAFVSDVARLKALYEYGGIYLDVDVLVFQKFDKILSCQCVFGFEEGNYVATSFMACVRNHPLIGDFLDNYNNEQFDNCVTNVTRLTDILIKKGLIKNGCKQQIEGDIVVYPKEFFSPYDYINCVMEKTDDTICAHLFYVSWMNKKERMKKRVKTILVRIIKKKRMVKLRVLLSKKSN